MVLFMGLLQPLGVGGSVLKGELPMSMNFATYVGKFCFDFSEQVGSRVGSLEVKVQKKFVRLPSDTNVNEWIGKGKLYFLLFDDEATHWKAAKRRWEVSTCEEKIESAVTVMEMLSTGQVEKATHVVHIREHIRPRFWYFAFVACDMALLEPVVYEVHALNEQWGVQKEFSLDHVGVVVLFAVFSVVFLVATFATDRAARCVGGRDHPYIKLLLLSYVASSASCGCLLTHYLMFMENGFGSQRIRFLGFLAAIVANCTIFLIAILSSVGWAVSCTVLPYRRLILGAVTAIGAMSAFCELHAEVTLDHSTKLYGYQSTPGVLALLFKLLMFFWFAFQIKMTYDEEPDEKHRRFYKFMGVSFTLWSLNVPVTMVLAFELSPWYRYKVVTSVDIIARFLGQALLTQLFCGPTSPITRDNTFRYRDDYEFAQFDHAPG